VSIAGRGGIEEKSLYFGAAERQLCVSVSVMAGEDNLEHLCIIVSDDLDEAICIPVAAIVIAVAVVIEDEIEGIFLPILVLLRLGRRRRIANSIAAGRLGYERGARGACNARGW